MAANPRRAFAIAYLALIFTLMFADLAIIFWRVGILGDGGNAQPSTHCVEWRRS